MPAKKIQPVSESNVPQTLLGAARHFADPQVCHNFLTRLRWPQGVTCLRCGCTDLCFLQNRQQWRCKNKECKYQFGVKVGTIFEKSQVSLDKWLPTIWMIANAKNGISSCEVARALGVTQKTAWFMLHRIREAMQSDGFRTFVEQFAGTVEVDETYIGGLNKNKHTDKKIKGRGTIGKTIVMGLLERNKEENCSRVRTFVINNTNGSTLHTHIQRCVMVGSEVFTDSLPAYIGIAPDYKHDSVDHGHYEYGRGRVHTNGIENFWSVEKRGLKGTYIKVEPFHLFRYNAEAEFRFNNRDGTDADRFLKAITGTVGRRLSYVQLIGTYKVYFDTLTW